MHSSIAPGMKALHHPRLSPLAFALAGLIALCTALTAAASSLNLPELGDSTSAVVSRQQEQEMGEAWLRMFRSRVPDYNDPEIEAWLEQLLQRIVQHSSLRNKELHLVLISNPTINAFAAPGGIIGVHSGLLLTAQSEGEVASVLSHELAHLSQRHWVRSVEAAQQNRLPALAAMLTGLILMATNNGQAGMAAITSAQAASLESSLRFSRQNEQEADNIGMQTLVEAGYSPEVMTQMFERLLESQRFQGKRPPEYLLSHPVTEKRVADSEVRARQLPRSAYTDSLDYHLIRARVQLHHEENPSMAVKRFQSEVEGASLHPEASRYGLALALIQARRFAEAETALNELLRQRPQQSHYWLASVQLDLERGDAAAAIKRLSAMPQNQSFPARMLLAKAYMQQQQYPSAEQVYAALAQQRPEDVHVWYELAEVRGLAGNIAGVHLARAEYFLLNGIYDKARKHLEYAQQLLKDSYVDSERIKQKLIEIDALEKASLEI